MRSRKPTFNDVVTSLAARNRRCLLKKAREANRLAKEVHTRSRARLYRVKANSLLALIEMFPKQTRISLDHREPNMIVVSVKEYRRNASLHMPKASLLNHIATDIHFKGPVRCLDIPRSG